MRSQYLDFCISLIGVSVFKTLCVDALVYVVGMGIEFLDDEVFYFAFENIKKWKNCV